MTAAQIAAYAAPLTEAEVVRREVIRFNLSRPLIFDLLTPAEFAAIYNGYGPDSWPASLRAAITWIYDNWTVLAGVHDVDFHFSDGTEKGWLEATARWGINASLALEARYPLRKPWLYPARVIAWLKLRASYRALQLGSWGAWVDAHARRVARETESLPVSPGGASVV